MALERYRAAACPAGSGAPRANVGRASASARSVSMGGDRVSQAAMLAHYPSCRVGVLCWVPLQPTSQRRRRRCGKRGVARRAARDLLVELRGFHLRKPRPITSGPGVLGLPRSATAAAAPPWMDVPRGKARFEHLQHLPDVKDLLDVVAMQCAHHGAPPRPRLHEPFDFEHADRFPNREPGHAKLLSQIPLANGSPRLQPAIDDPDRSLSPDLVTKRPQIVSGQSILGSHPPDANAYPAEQGPGDRSA